MAVDPFVVLYGPPGAGKTTLCNYLQENFGFFYANMAADPRFRSMTVWKLVADICVSNGKPAKGIVTEGVLAYRAPRDTFVHNICRTLQREFGVKYNPLIVRVVEPPSVLVTRRPHRSLAAYEQYPIEPGSERFPHVELDGRLYPTLEDRARFILGALRG